MAPGHHRPGGGSPRGSPVNSEVKFQSLCAEGDQSMRRGLYQRAINAYDKALEVNPKDRTTLLSRCKCHIMAGSPEQAITDADAAIGGDQAYYKGIYYKAEALYASGEFEFALAHYHRANKLRSDLMEHRLGIQKAENSISQAIALGKNPQLERMIRTQSNILTPQSAQILSDGGGPLPSIRGSQTSRLRNVSTPRELGAPSGSQSARIYTSTMADSTDMDYSDDDSPSGGYRKKRQARPATQRKLLGTLYDDKSFLESLANDPIFAGTAETPATGAGGDIGKIIGTGLKYLDSRMEFWRQQRGGRQQHAGSSGKQGAKKPARVRTAIGGSCRRPLGESVGSSGAAASSSSMSFGVASPRVPHPPRTAPAGGGSGGRSGYGSSSRGSEQQTIDVRTAGESSDPFPIPPEMRRAAGEDDDDTLASTRSDDIALTVSDGGREGRFAGAAASPRASQFAVRPHKQSPRTRLALAAGGGASSSSSSSGAKGGRRPKPPGPLRGRHGTAVSSSAAAAAGGGGGGSSKVPKLKLGQVSSPYGRTGTTPVAVSNSSGGGPQRRAGGGRGAFRGSATSRAVRPSGAAVGRRLAAGAGGRVGRKGLGSQTQRTYGKTPRQRYIEQSRFVAQALENIRYAIDNGSYEMALKFCKRLQAKLGVLHIPDVPRILGNVYSAMGSVYYELRKPSLALVHHKKDLELSLEHRFHDAYIRALRNLGRTYQQTGETAAAVGMYLKALSVVHGPRAKADTCLQLGQCLFDTEKWTEALDYAQQSIAILGEAKEAKRLEKLSAAQSAMAVSVTPKKPKPTVARFGKKPGSQKAGTTTVAGGAAAAGGGGIKSVGVKRKSKKDDAAVFGVFGEPSLREIELDAICLAGRAHCMSGDLDESETVLNRCLQQAQEWHDRTAEAAALTNLSIIAMQRGKTDLGMKYQQQALAISKSMQ